MSTTFEVLASQKPIILAPCYLSCFEHFLDPPPELHFGATYAGLVPKSRIWGPSLEPTGVKQGSQNDPRAPKKRAQQIPKASPERPRQFITLRAARRPCLSIPLVTLTVRARFVLGRLF